MIVTGGIDQITTLPKPALGLLAAVHDATVAAVATQGALPAAVAGAVIRNSGTGEIVLPPYGAWPAAKLLPNELAGSDGRFWYRVARYGATNSYYPLAFDRVVYTLAFTAASLPLRTDWRLDRRWFVRLLANNTDAQWVLFYEVGMRTSEANPSPTGPNIKGYTWRTPLVALPLQLTDVVSQHDVGVSLRRNLEGTTEVWAGQVTLYGKTLAALPEQLPSGGNDFVLRLRLGCFDVQDDVAEPRGYAAFYCMDPANETSQ